MRTWSLSGSRKSLGEGNGNPLQYSSLGNPTDRGAWHNRLNNNKQQQPILGRETNHNSNQNICKMTRSDILLEVSTSFFSGSYKKKSLLLLQFCSARCFVLLPFSRVLKRRALSCMPISKEKGLRILIQKNYSVEVQAVGLNSFLASQVTYHL